MSESHGEQAGAGKRFRLEQGKLVCDGEQPVKEMRFFFLSEAAAFTHALEFNPFHLCLSSNLPLVLVLSSSSFSVFRKTQSVLTVGKKKLDPLPRALCTLVSHSRSAGLSSVPACPQRDAPFHCILLRFPGRFFE